MVANLLYSTIYYCTIRSVTTGANNDPYKGYQKKDLKNANIYSLANPEESQSFLTNMSPRFDRGCVIMLS